MTVRWPLIDEKMRFLNLGQQALYHMPLPCPTGDAGNEYGT
jgi:hypothetical protein